MIQRSVDCVFDEHRKAKADTRIAGIDEYGLYLRIANI